jgi:polyvinyl alcohol dehydrogenase (cytochrome)
MVGGVQWGMVSDGQRVYAAVSDVVMTNPTDPLDTRRFVLDRHAGGGLTALRIADGSKAWYALPADCKEAAALGCSPAQSAALTGIPGVIFSGSLDGHLRAFAAEDGKVLWDFDTVREYQTVNGVKGTGGSLDDLPLRRYRRRLASEKSRSLFPMSSAKKVRSPSIEVRGQERERLIRACCKEPSTC